MTSRGRVGSGVLALGLLLIYLLTASSTPSVDASSASLQGWRIATTGSPWLDDLDLDELPVRYTDPPFWTGENVSGHLVVYRSPGVTAASTLAYLGQEPDPSRFSIRPASLLAAALAWATVLLVYGAVRRHLSHKGALAVSGVLAFGTPVWSVAADAMWPHTLTTLGIAGMAFAASRERWLVAGLMGGIGLTGRLHLSLVIAVLGTSVGFLRRRPSITVLVAATSLPFLLLSAAWSRWLYGQWDPAGGYPQVDAYADRATSQSAVDLLSNHLGLWVSADRGFLTWTPIVIVLVPAVVRSWRHQPDWARMLLVGGVLYTIVQSLMNHFAGGTAFYGYRLTLELLLCSVPVLAFSLGHLGRWATWAAPVVAGLQVGAIALGATFNSVGLPLDAAWTRNAFVTAMVEVPALVVPWALCGVLGLLLVRAASRNPTSTPEQAHQRG